MRKSIIIFIFFAVIVIGSSCEGNYKKEVVGAWNLTNKTTGCFSKLNFLSDPSTDMDPVSAHETVSSSANVSFTQIWFGEYEQEKDRLTVTFHEPVAEPFSMQVKRNENELILQYDWKEQSLDCTYQLAE